VAVTGAAGEGVFHHLESAGRRNLAASDTLVGVAWEDERDGTPRIYLARKGLAAPAFGEEVRVSGPGEAFEPSLAALPGDRFALAWEEDGQVQARLVGPAGPGPLLRLGGAGDQAHLAPAGGDLVALWAEREGPFGRIRMARLGAGDGLALRLRGGCPVDPSPPAADQLYPAAGVVDGRVVAAWEDRRPGHTIIMAAASEPLAAAGAGCRFGAPRRISDDPPGPQMPYGKGHGVSRVAVGAYGAQGLLAAWADKRHFRHGYDIYGADYAPGRGFGPNERIQDDFGELARQWHAAVAGHPGGRLVVAWDDDREGTADLMLSWREAGGWSDDAPVPGASGPGEQAHPAVALDAAGNLHLAWVEREAPDGATRLRYLFGRARGD
jgi:hypothetical protein